MARPTNYQVTLQDVQRPAEIVNYRSMGTTPALLGLALALSSDECPGVDARRLGAETATESPC